MMDRSKTDYLWLLVACLLIILLASLPNWAGYQAETPEMRFRGIYFDSQDYAVHMSMLEAGRHGEWAYQFRFTTEPHRAAYVRLFYVVLGHLSRVLRIPVETMFELARWAFGLLALFTLYKLMEPIFAPVFWRRTAFLLAAMGSGMGWLQWIINWTPGIITPIDFWLIDSYVFFSISLFPHFSFVTAGMCTALLFWLRYLKNRQWTNILWIGLCAILVQFANPIAFATVDAGLVGATLFAWWRKERIRLADLGALVLVALAQVPGLAYNFFVLNHDPLWSQFTAQNQTLSPPPVYYLLGFALFWPLAIYGAIIAIQRRSVAAGAAILWTSSAFLLAYARFFIQRRFLQNITIPLAILSTLGLVALFERWLARNPGGVRWRPHLVLAVIFLVSISSIQLGIGQSAFLRTHPENLYYPASIDGAVHWFQENARYNDFVLAAEQTSQILVQKTGLRAYMGHQMETLHYAEKKADVEAFFQGERQTALAAPIRWVVYGPYERILAPAFQAPPELELVYDQAGVQIYHVR